jgi:hypothetical protein
MRRIETMKRLATTTWYVLVAVLMWGTVGTPGMVLCVTEGGTAIEWAPGGSCAPGVASATRAVGSGVVDGTCGPCFDVPVGESQLRRSSDRLNRITMTGVPASPAVLCNLLPSSREFQPNLPQHSPPIADSLRSVVLLI